MAQSLLNDRAMVPLFALEDRDGVLFDPQDLRRQRHLVLLFLNNLPSPLLISIEENISKIREKNTELAVICSMPLQEIEHIYKTHRLTFRIFFDDRREVLSKFVKAKEEEDVAALFIVDKNGALFFQYVVHRYQDLPPPQDVVRSLDLLESQ